MERDFTPSGVTQEVGSRVAAARLRFDEAIRVAELSGDHVWTVIVSHHIRNAEALADPSSLLLDGESVADIRVGCYVCEKPYEAREIKRRCPGEPKIGGPR